LFGHVQRHAAGLFAGLRIAGKRLVRQVEEVAGEV
jgi:hypothetical protein